MPPLVIPSLRGGLNEAAAIGLADDECQIATNVEWLISPLGERRKGAQQIGLSAALNGCNRVHWIYRHLPTTNLSDAQLWVLGMTAASVPVLAYKDTTWHEVTMPDAMVLDGRSEYEIDAQTLHGKLFLAYRSAVDRLHVWEPGATALRRCGLLGVKTAPTVAGFGTGTFASVRYYRVRFTRQVAAVTKNRSEPTDPVTYTPPVAPAALVQGARVTRPTPPGDGETHWELEGSLDNANFYRIGTAPIATTTLDDTTSGTLGYQASGLFPLAEDISDNIPIPSVRYLAADEDRLVGAGHHSDPALGSRVLWTPVYGGTGVGNDERIALDTNPYLDLDNYEGGGITDISDPINGYLYISKWSHIYQLTRTGVRTRAYEAVPLTKQRGAVHKSMVSGFNQAGIPFLFAIDPDIGPIHIGGPNGVVPCGKDLAKTWPLFNEDAIISARGLYYGEHEQIHWWVCLQAGQNVPTHRLVLHHNLMSQPPQGARGGFAFWDGFSNFNVYSVCMFSDNIDEPNAPRSRYLKPFVAGQIGGLIWRTDVGDLDNGTAYTARLKTKPYARTALLDAFEIGETVLMAKAGSAKLDVVVTGHRSDKSTVTKSISNISLAALSGETTDVVRSLDNLGLAELQTVSFDIQDAASVAGARWELQLIAATVTPGQQSRGRG